MSFFHTNPQGHTRLYIDGSTTRDFAKCDTYGALSGFLGLKALEDNIHLRCGQAVHLAIESWWTHWDVERALQAFGDDYLQWSNENVAPDHAKRYDNVLDVLRFYMEDHPESTLPFTVDPAYIEIGCCAPLDENVVYYGRLDALVKSAGAYYIVDTKTTGRLNKNWGNQWKFDAQIDGYTWLAGQQTSLPVAGFFINGMELKEVSKSDAGCKDHGCPRKECARHHLNTAMVGPITRTPEQLEHWRKAALAEAYRYWAMCAQCGDVEGLPDVPMTGKFTGKCYDYQNWCAFYEFCYASKPTGVDGRSQAREMFRYDPWEPFDPIKGER